MSFLTVLALEVMGVVYAHTQMSVVSVVVLSGSFYPSSCCIDEVLSGHMAPVVLIFELARIVFKPGTTIIF